jgi:hypothetical protein
MSTVKMNALAIGGTIQLPATGNVTVPADGLISVDSTDVAALLRMGATYIMARTKSVNILAPRAASAGRLVASTALSNGTKTIAAQPDVPRQGVLRIDPGTSAITAGNVAINYLANDGTTVTDNVSAIMGGTTVVSTNTSKGIVTLNSVIVTAIAGGASPQVQLNDTNSLSVSVDPGFVDFTLLAEFADATNEGQVAIASSAASFTPSTTPNSTHNYGAFYGFNAPNT